MVIIVANFLIMTDTRQKSDKYITSEFDKQNILHIRTTLPSADYMAIRYDSKKGFYKDYSILIDTKKDILEMCGNLCRNTEHERIKREIQKAKDLGCKNFIFLISDNKIKNVQDIKNWNSKYTKVKGTTLLKIMKTMSERYNVKFIFTSRKNIGNYIINIFEKSCKEK
jgi:hypothetical protein